jgi:hypothetical protein
VSASKKRWKKSGEDLTSMAIDGARDPDQVSVNALN